MNSRVRSRGGSTLPSTAITSLAVTSSAGELMTRPVVTRFAARMLLPVGAAFGSSRVAVAIPLAGTVEFRTVLARTRKPGTFFAAPVVTRAVKAWLVEIARTVTGGTGIALAAILALLPRLCVAAIPTAIGTVTKIFSRPPVAAVALAIRSAARKLLVAAKFSLRPIATRTIAIARRPGAIGPIAPRTITVFATAFTARRIGPLLATTFSRGIRLPLAKFPVGKAASRTRIVAITAWRTVVAIEIRPIAARLERTLLAAAIIARANILARSAVSGVALAVSGGAVPGKQPIGA